MDTVFPDVRHFEDFYIWFNKEQKQEYYTTPLYLYKANFSFEYDNEEITDGRLIYKNRS